MSTTDPGRDPALTVTPITLLHGHTSPETAHIAEDYPYGPRLRCRRRSWIDTGTRNPYEGHQRWGTQTSDPRRDNTAWNKPKYGVYHYLARLWLDEQGHVQLWCVSPVGGPEQIVRAELLSVPDQLDGDDADRWRLLAAASRKFNPNVWAQFDTTVDEIAAHIAATGADPHIENGTWQRPDDGPVYLMGAPEVYVSEARRRLTNT